MKNARHHSLLAGWDKKHVWHPFTQQAEWEKADPLVVRSARGMRFTDARGRSYLDGVSSLWVTAHGHRHPALDRAVAAQLKKMAHTTFLGLTHEPAVRLARELVRLAPPGLSRVFYSDNGSTAVEVALKMAYQYWAQKDGGSRRREFLALENSYHGDTLGSVSVGGIRLFHKKFKPLLFKARFAMSPSCYRCPYRKKDPGAGSAGYAGRFRPDGTPRNFTPRPGNLRAETGCRWECLASAEKILKARAGRLAAAIVEPGVQAAAGMLVMPPGYLRGLERLCRRNGVLLIADEVATGFGRTGKMFAVEHEGVRPDFLCAAKTLTGGYLPLAATLAREKIYRAFLGRHEDFKTFFHGHTYTANPLACAAALANLRLFRSTGMPRSLGGKIKALRKFLKEVRALPGVGDARQFGLMAGIELAADKKTGRPFPAAARAAQKVCRAALARGLWLRPLGDVVVLMPILAISTEDLKKTFAVLKRSLSHVTDL
ncbi:MAG: aminotransferase family protein [Elusimicrobiota bacterium]